jgi:hypothetical protein
MGVTNLPSRTTQFCVHTDHQSLSSSQGCVTFEPPHQLVWYYDLLPSRAR